MLARAHGDALDADGSPHARRSTADALRELVASAHVDPFGPDARDVAGPALARLWEAELSRVDDTATVGTGGTVGISVLGNDTDPDGHTLSVTTPAPTAAKGTVTCSSTSCSYTAHLGESGTDTFTSPSRR